MIVETFLDLEELRPASQTQEGHGLFGQLKNLTAWRQPDIVVSDDLCRSLRHEGSMFDDFHTVLDGTDNRGVVVGMDRDIGAVIASRFSRGLEFFGGVLNSVQRIDTGGHATACHDLDLNSSSSERLPHRALYLPRTVGNE